jgi:hypothetical protein
VLCRFKEYNILTDSLILTNEVMKLSYLVDKMNVTRTSDSFTASFVEGVMFTQYQSASVPAGWLVPLLYINVGRLEKEEDEIAKVNIIVPHSQGHQSAVTGVYPCYYEITYQTSVDVRHALLERVDIRSNVSSRAHKPNTGRQPECLHYRW